jgi:uncharacterized protein with GYD domain
MGIGQEEVESSMLTIGLHNFVFIDEVDNDSKQHKLLQRIPLGHRGDILAYSEYQIQDTHRAFSRLAGSIR